MDFFIKIVFAVCQSANRRQALNILASNYGFTQTNLNIIFERKPYFICDFQGINIFKTIYIK